MPFFENAHNVHISSSKFQEISGNVFVFNDANDGVDVAGGTYGPIPTNFGPNMRPHRPFSRYSSSREYFNATLYNDRRNIEHAQRQYTTPAQIQYASPRDGGSWRNSASISYDEEVNDESETQRRLGPSPRSSSFPAPVLPSKIRSTAPLEPYASSQDADERSRSSRSRTGSNPSGTTLQKTIREVRPLITRLNELFSDTREYQQLLSSQGSTAQELLDIFQYILDEPEAPTAFRRQLIGATQRLAAKSGLFPMAYELDAIKMAAGSPEYVGGFGDIYKADLNGQSVCLKVVRSGGTARADLVKAFAKEAVLWSQLSHPNLLPFYGIHRFKSHFALVSPWMAHGEIGNYLRGHPNVDRLLLVFDIISGLYFLHKNGIIHGDLKSPNILVDSSERAQLADFGISSVSDPNILAWTSHSRLISKGGSIRWQAPELFDPESEEIVHNTMASDIYSWSCVVYEVYSGKIPFSHFPMDPTVMFRVTMGERPARPPELSSSWLYWGLTEDIWSLLDECWKADPAGRPTTEEVIDRLKPMLMPDNRPCEESAVLSSATFRSSAHTRLNGEDISVDRLNSLLGCRKSYMDGFESTVR